MSERYLTIKAIERDGAFYPVGSETAVPADTVVVTDPARFDLHHGDIIVDASGKPWLIDFDEDRTPKLAAVEVSLRPSHGITVDEIEAPFVVAYREGETIDLLIEA